MVKHVAIDLTLGGDDAYVLGLLKQPDKRVNTILS
jgi:hypothetical protein